MKLVFFGTPEFAAPSLRHLSAEPGFQITLVVSQPDRKVGRSQVVTPPPIAREAQELGLPLLQPAKLTGDLEFLGRLKRGQPDVFVVVAYGKILPAELLAMPRFGGINLHASLLPKYRGASPIQAAILAGDRETGVTVMKMTEALDEGPICSQRAVEIFDADDAAILSERLAREGADLLVLTLHQIAAGKAAARPQTEEASYCRTVRREDGEVSWRKPASEILRMLKAYTPWPGIFTFLDGERIKVLQAAEGSGGSASPGSLVRLSGGSFAIACAGSALVPLLLQREGKNPVTAEEFLRGLPQGNVRFGK
jgi:methionyl-tRNA formyltransferase